MSLRHELSPGHPVIGDDYILLKDTDYLEKGDETQCVSMLLANSRSAKWEPISPEWDDCIGFTIGAICDEMGNADGYERVFRRKVHV